MNITVQINLPEAVAAEAKAQGLLEPHKLAQLLERELKLDQPMRNFREMVEQLRACPDEPMTMNEVQVIVNDVRVERRKKP